ncbi:hypothetical protein TraAM80_04917 [Trypanosoma rangeli]|uniref:Uncharacterized protein n=1 Tax=Trypanosoma rangeli TaxID=5698 RepID=A0A422NH59_TRYRA|nr:uncharacterized protein TraAM80_04917 [Trypanosoma rangeli]RNF04791.1 hypothetical protein TraAM80_04917 [Trypanosoma rangeli]|eukprot:RNF04791.1 hypothetical protein TraAM80_04917 [Trypanosoma rangeli]
MAFRGVCACRTVGAPFGVVLVCIFHGVKWPGLTQSDGSRLRSGMRAFGSAGHVGSSLRRCVFVSVPRVGFTERRFVFAPPHLGEVADFFFLAPVEAQAMGSMGGNHMPRFEGKLCSSAEGTPRPCRVPSHCAAAVL